MICFNRFKIKKNKREISVLKCKKNFVKSIASFGNKYMLTLDDQ